MPVPASCSELLDSFFKQVNKDYRKITPIGFITDFDVHSSGKRSLFFECHEDIQKERVEAGKEFIHANSFTIINTLDALLKRDKRSEPLKIVFGHFYIGEDQYQYYLRVYDKKLIDQHPRALASLSI